MRFWIQKNLARKGDGPTAAASCTIACNGSRHVNQGRARTESLRPRREKNGTLPREQRVDLFVVWLGSAG